MADLKSGCILFDIKFKFKDNEIGEKLIFILNNPKGNEPYLICRTTSKETAFRRRDPKGCKQNGKYFFLGAGDAYFEKDTWLQLDNIFEYKKTL